MKDCLNFIAVFDDKIKGNVKFHQCSKKHNVVVTFDLSGFKPDVTKAIHIHEFGDTTNGCESLGAHLNLKNTEHGSIYVDIHNSHTGDLINNLTSDKFGNFKYEYQDPRLNLFGDISNSIIGCSVVIHNGEDDLGLGGDKTSKTTGNAGSRMSCAVIGKMKN